MNNCETNGVNIRSEEKTCITVEPTPKSYSTSSDPSDPSAVDSLSELTGNRETSSSPSLHQMIHNQEDIDDTHPDKNVEAENQIGKSTTGKSITIVAKTVLVENNTGSETIAEKTPNQCSTNIKRSSLRTIHPTLPPWSIEINDKYWYIKTFCDLCEKKFADNRNYRRHMLNKHYQETQTFLACGLCDKTFATKSGLDYHMELHSNKVYECEVCIYQTPHKQQLDKHVKNHHTARDKTFNCDKCTISFYTAAKLKTHRLLHGEKKFICDTCQRGYVSKRLLLRHIELKHLFKNNVECEYCYKKFIQRATMIAHKNTVHLKLKPFECNICDKAFGCRSYLTKHMFIHEDTQKYVCDKCKKSFRCSFSLKTHINQYHLSIKPYKCDVCDKTFARADYLQKHRLLHTGEKPFQCDICRKYVSRWSNMRTHLLSHERIRSKFACKKCPLKFLRENDLKAHVCEK